MRGKLTVVVGAAVLLLSSQAGSVVRAVDAQTAGGDVTAPDSTARFVQTYCTSCHNPRLKSGGVSLSAADAATPDLDAELWERVVRKVRTGMMPPQQAPRPDPAVRHAFVSHLETVLDTAAARTPHVVPSFIHRMNRAEYANAIRDLLDLEVDATSMLPPDDSGYGFDNIADTLGVSPILVESYLRAAGKISALAVGDTSPGASSQTYRVRQDASQDVHSEGLPIGTVGGLLARAAIPVDGEYVLAVKLYRTNTSVVRGLESVHQVDITVDGERVHLGTFGGDADFKASLENPTTAGDAIDARLVVRLPLRAGPRSIGAAFLEVPTISSMRLQPFVRSSIDTLDPAGHPHIDTLTITGPIGAARPGDTPSRRRVFTCTPRSAADELPCAKTILSTLARRAYRRPVTAKDLSPLMSFFDTGRRAGGFEKGIQVALQRLLADPGFAFRAERQSPIAPAGVPYRVSDVDLASRLSFFLWSSIPDDRLVLLASQGRLSDPAILRGEVVRMLADAKANALVKNFASQWLYLRNLRNQVPNSVEFPDFDDNLRRSFQTEAEMFFESVVREDRNVLDLMTANYTFVNERLARHYGIRGVYGSHFRRVTLQEPSRYGLLGKGAILMVTSHADGTSPVVRGKWVLDNLLGAPPPAPPANVPPLPDQGSGGGQPLTMRQRLEKHRENPVCASCHAVMDPIGFSMENFDAVGAWRTHDSGTPIDPTGQMRDGTPLDGVVALRRALLRDPSLFVGTLTEKLLTYALGRGLTYDDMPVVRATVRDAASADYRFSSLVIGIVKSAPFQFRSDRKAEPRPPGASDVARQWNGKEFDHVHN